MATGTLTTGDRAVKQYFFNQIAFHPLAQASPEEIRKYRFPADHVDDLLQSMIPVGQDASRFFIGCDVSPCAFEMYWRLRGMENTMIDLVSDMDLASYILKSCADFSITLAEKVIERYPLDWLWTGDDVASQHAMMISPKTWRRWLARAGGFAVGEHHRGWLTTVSGALRPIIPDLIEIGMDVLTWSRQLPGHDPFELP
jgi:uroporphyrinogen decarboxylase